MSHAIFWPLRVVVDTFWAIIDSVLMFVLLLVIVVMSPIFLVKSFLG